jgi:hypothetical protein
MKRNTVLFYILTGIAVLGNAQIINPSRYREITLPQFEEWKQGLPREGTEPTRFKSRVFFEEVSETTISFADPGNRTSIYFTVDKTWPEMEEGQPVTIYFTASGSWSWNRVLDEIDRGPARGQPGDDPSGDGIAYDQTGDDGGEDPGFGEFADPDQDAFPARTETLDQDERGASPQGQPSRLPPPCSAPRPDPAAPGASPAAPRITGPAPRPGRVYRLQVGSYLVERNAARAFARLKEAGFSPNYEQHGQYLRVVLSGIRAADVRAYAERIALAGFGEIWCREER